MSSSSTSLRVHAIGDYRVIPHSKIGSGSYGKVMKAYHVDTPDKIVAVKIVKKSRLPDKALAYMIQEVRISEMLNHENVVKLMWWTNRRDHVYQFSEYCSGGDLLSFSMKWGPFDERIVSRWAYQLVLGLKYLRNLNLVHRDLKPDNILLSECSENAVLKIADFGFAREINPSSLSASYVGTPLYMAPEVLNSEEYGPKADLWSFGCILFHLLFHRVPYTAHSEIQLNTAIRTKPLQRPTDRCVSDECWDFIENLLRLNPLERISFDNLESHPFVVKYKDFLEIPNPNPNPNPNPDPSDVSTSVVQPEKSEATVVESDSEDSGSEYASADEMDYDAVSTNVDSDLVVEAAALVDDVCPPPKSALITERPQRGLFTSPPPDDGADVLPWLSSPKSKPRPGLRIPVNDIVLLSHNPESGDPDMLNPQRQVDFCHLSCADDERMILDRIETHARWAWVVTDTVIRLVRQCQIPDALVLLTFAIEMQDGLLNEIDATGLLDVGDCSASSGDRKRAMFDWLSSHLNNSVEVYKNLRSMCSESQPLVAYENLLYRDSVELAKEAVVLSHQGRTSLANSLLVQSLILADIVSASIRLNEDDKDLVFEHFRRVKRVEKLVCSG